MAISSNSLELKFAPDINLFSKLISSLFKESIVFLNSSVFSLLLYKDENRLNMKPFTPKFESLGKVFNSLWERIKGI